MVVIKCLLAVCTTLPLLLISYISMCFMIWSMSLAIYLEEKLMGTKNIRDGLAKTSIEFADKIHEIVRNPR
jgi:hypothetical protein